MGSIAPFRRFFGIIRSLVVYHGLLGRQRRLRKLYALFTQPGDLTFDLGAHAGNRTRALVALGCRVVSVEPQNDFACLLRLFFSRQPSVLVIQAAVGDQNGRTTLSVSDTNPTMTTIATEWQQARQKDPLFAGVHWNRSIEVDQVTLDLLISKFGRPAFVKIDVEGAEPRVLAGLSQPITALSFEYLPDALNYAESCIRMLMKLGIYQFNWSPGESYQLASNHWMDGDTVLEALKTLPAQRRSGDIYARLTESLQRDLHDK
ncbi:MAG: methyltransferase [Acidobacteria bacterium]|nr:methyltransferase [Acidobacteriota bacterium]|tara:strand:- start:1 stop:783 length:783 start_codon:yes stop_codon:yes gene_type:complete